MVVVVVRKLSGEGAAVHSPEGEALHHNTLVVVVEDNIHPAVVGVGLEDLEAGSNHQIFLLRSSR